MPKTGRFYVSQSDSGAKYIIPLEKRQEWENFVDFTRTNDVLWDTPEYAVPFDGGLLTFCSWKIL